MDGKLLPESDCRCAAQQGHVLYYGQASHTDHWFAALGYRLPYKINVADFILDISSSDVSTPERCSTPHPPQHCPNSAAETEVLAHAVLLHWVRCAGTTHSIT